MLRGLMPSAVATWVGLAPNYTATTPRSRCLLSVAWFSARIGVHGQDCQDRPLVAATIPERFIQILLGRSSWVPCTRRGLQIVSDWAWLWRTERRFRQRWAGWIGYRRGCSRARRRCWLG